MRSESVAQVMLANFIWKPSLSDSRLEEMRHVGNVAPAKNLFAAAPPTADVLR
jgi:hypothetical protein